MSWIEWKESYRLGIPSVDYEHEELIALLKAFEDRALVIGMTVLHELPLW